MRTPKERQSTHPGVYIQDDILDERGITVEQLSGIIKVDVRILKDIVSQESPITKEIAIKIAHLTKTSSDMWMNMQKLYDEADTKK